MTTYLSDSFTDTANTNLEAHTPETGSQWTAGGAAGQNKLTGNGCVYRPAGSMGIPNLSAAIPTTDYQIDCVINVKSLLASDGMTLFARMVDGSNGYAAYIQQSGAVGLQRFVSNTPTSLQTGSVTVTASTTPKFSLRIQGNTIQLLWNDAVILTATDSTYASAGKVGIRVGFSSSTAQTTTTGIQADSFLVTDYVAGPVNTVAPSITGTRVAGQTLSCSTGTWTGTPTSYAYQWQTDASGSYADLSGATSTTYTLQGTDATHNIRCVVTATNASGSSSANSNALAVVGEIVQADVQFWTAAGGGLGGSPSVAIPSPSSVYDSVTHAEAVTGDTEYRVVYLKNTHAVRSLTGTVVWISTQTNSLTTEIAIGVAQEAAGSDVTAIPDEGTAPAGVTFSEPSSSGAGISIGALAPGQARGVWLKWIVLADTVELPADTCTLSWTGTPG